MEKRKGIWLDFRQADIISLEGDESRFETLSSGIEEFKPKGGSFSNQPWGAVETVSEKSYLERRKRQETAFFKRILDKLHDATAIYIFGPAEAKIGLIKAIKENPPLAEKLQQVDSADSMTKNQKIAVVKSFYE